MFNAITQLVNIPTYLKDNILDIVITNDDLRIFDLSVLLQNHRPFQRDHLLVEFSVRSSNIPSNKYPTKFLLNYAKGDYATMNYFLLDLKIHCLPQMSTEPGKTSKV